MKLRKWVKVALTIIILIVGILIYSKIGKIGELAQENKLYLVLCIADWLWLICGTSLTLYYIWEN